jgi:hypothetical protein
MGTSTNLFKCSGYLIKNKSDVRSLMEIGSSIKKHIKPIKFKLFRGPIVNSLYLLVLRHHRIRLVLFVLE